MASSCFFSSTSCRSFSCTASVCVLSRAAATAIWLKAGCHCQVSLRADSQQTCTQERALMSESALETPCGRDGIVGAVHRVRALAQLEFASSRPCSTCLQSCQLRPIQNLSPTDAATDKKTSIKLGQVFSISLLCSIASVCVALRLRSLLFPQPVYVASRYF